MNSVGSGRYLDITRIYDPLLMWLRPLVVWRKVHTWYQKLGANSAYLAFWIRSSINSSQIWSWSPAGRDRMLVGGKGWMLGVVAVASRLNVIALGRRERCKSILLMGPLVEADCWRSCCGGSGSPPLLWGMSKAEAMSLENAITREFAMSWKGY